MSDVEFTEASENSFSIMANHQLTETVNRALNNFDLNEEIFGWDIIQAVITNHPEYGAGHAEKLLGKSGPENGLALTMTGWGEKLDVLFTSSAQPVHGRLLIIGLAELDSAIKTMLREYGIYDSIVKEIKEPLDSLLIREEASPTPTPNTSEIPDTPIFHTDAVKNQDQLGRSGFVKALASRLRHIWNDVNEQHSESGPSYVVQLDGPWGSGKSTLLSLLEQELTDTLTKQECNRQQIGPKSGGEWIVIKFNAWQYQRLNPPWWPLLDTLYQGSVASMNDANEQNKVRKFERSWRRNNLPGYQRWKKIPMLVISGILLGLVVAGLRLLEINPADSPLLKTLKDMVELASGAIGLLLIIWGVAASLVSEWLAPSTESAKQFESLVDDSMGKLQTHFADLLSQINRPVIVLIDDLDRCRSEYVVHLLEGIQTLFNDSRVFYIIAADRRWLSACFSHVYNSFENEINEPARPLGRLFLEKTFQLEISVPGMTPDLKENYLKYLLKVSVDGDPVKHLHELEKEAEKEFANLENDQAVFNSLSSSQGSPLLEQARREAAVVQLASRPVEEKREQFLQRYWHLMESNPRSMKRLIQAYGMNLTIVTLRDPQLVITIEARQQLVLWTILTLRWPQLADCLRESPQQLNSLKSANVDLSWMDQSLENLAVSDAVRKVINGDQLNGELQAETLKLLVSVLSPRA